MPKRRELSQWLEDFPVEEVKQELGELEEEAGRIEWEIRSRRRLLEIRAQALGLDNEDGQTQLDAFSKQVAKAWQGSENLLKQVRAYGGGKSYALHTGAHGAREGATPPPTLKASVPETEAGSSNEQNAASDRGGADAEVRLMSRAQMLLSFLNKYRGESWKLSVIRDHLVADGLMEDTPRNTHGLQVSAARLARAGKLERTGPGVYRAPVNSQEGSRSEP